MIDISEKVGESVPEGGHQVAGRRPSAEGQELEGQTAETSYRLVG